jgi:hypothetical protein
MEIEIKTGDGQGAIGDRERRRLVVINCLVPVFLTKQTRSTLSSEYDKDTDCR